MRIKPLLLCLALTLPPMGCASSPSEEGESSASDTEASTPTEDAVQNTEPQDTGISSDGDTSVEPEEDTSAEPEEDASVEPEEDTSLEPEDTTDAGQVEPDTTNLSDTDAGDSPEDTNDTVSPDSEPQPCLSDSECNEVGELRCTVDGDGIEACEEIEEGCLQWIASDTCGEGFLCIDGACQSSCLPDCPEGWCGEDGCGGSCGPCLGGDKVCEDNFCVEDGDGDGFSITTDCDDTDPNINPGATEGPYDGKDNDCNPDTSDGDVDGDGAICVCMGGTDCDDTSIAYGPEAPDQVGDSTDFNCDGHDGVDSDGDFHASLDSGGDDCDDTLPGVHPGIFDVFGDDLDANCDGVDGYPAPEPPDGTLCVLTGQAEQIIDCPLGIVRLGETGLAPIGFQAKFYYHSSKATLIAVVGKSCLEDGCSEVDLGAGAPNHTGHSFSLWPNGSEEAPFNGMLGMVGTHMTSIATPLTDAYLDDSLFLFGDPYVATLRFQLKVDVAADLESKVVIHDPMGVSPGLESVDAYGDKGLIVINTP